MSTVLDGTFSFAEQRDSKTTHAVNNSLVAQNSCNTVHGQKVAKHKKCETMSIVKDISDYLKYKRFAEMYTRGVSCLFEQI